MFNQRKYLKERNKTLKKLNICIQCAKYPISINRSKYRCDNCLNKAKKINTDYLKKLRQQRRREKVCLNCGSLYVCNKFNIHTGRKNKELMCEICYLKKISKQHLGTSKKWQLLENLFKKQKGKCYYTGIKLTIGQNASIDHKICKAKNGQNNIENLCWADWKINLMKRDLDIQEFFKLCKIVVFYNKL
ncbi:MAG: hypothetical protein A2561_00605 [Candidatus Staskawiczbacteria bacterium RIFOXYD1_FULL_32_13]|uniref:HNH nuclease domain-containing protein n=1 Tax=Candidatus Staskawiczbacteria bacterium RIFOXYD1_FULL_32_13 TaxID=1802234 RepID=A0A1G2JNB7_9BACT|nr:MAG: hypothetical protein A2561_00605 [Candidatus Staskawiczbacteria bacterium RIFOXYD1_FULL_32_13]